MSKPLYKSTRKLNEELFVPTPSSHADGYINDFKVLTYSLSYVRQDQIDWVSNTPFTSVVRFKHLSANRAVFTDLKTGLRFGMYLSDFEEIIPFMDRGVIQGIFGVRKASDTYGVFLIEQT